jgi:hypothetical protein
MQDFAITGKKTHRLDYPSFAVRDIAPLLKGSVTDYPTLGSRPSYFY